MDFNRILNPKFLLHILARFWYLLLISLIFSLVGAFLYIKVTPNEYSTSVYVEVADKSSQSGIQNALDVAGMFGQLKNLDNEMRVIRSFPVFKKAVDSLDMNVSYFVEGDIKKMELYKNSPYEIELLESYHNLLHKTYIFEFGEGQKFRIYLDSLGLKKVKPELSGVFGDTLELNGNLIKVHKKQIYKSHNNLKYTFLVKSSEMVAQEFMSIINVSTPPDGSTILRLSLTGKNPEKQTDFLNELANVYIVRDVERKDNLADNTLRFIDSQIDEVYAKLSGVEDRLENFQLQNKLYTIGGTKGKVATTLEALEEEKENLILQDIYNQNLLEYLSVDGDMVLVPSGSNVEDGLLNNMISSLNNLYAERASLYDLEKENPRIVELDAKVQLLRSMLIESVKNIQKVSKITHKEIDEKIKDIERDLYGLPSSEREYVGINREYQLNSHIYNFLLEKKADVGIAKAAHSTENMMVEPARVSAAQKIAPDEETIYFNTAVLSLAVPYGLILLVFLFKNQIEGVKDVEDNTDIAMLAQITDFKGDDAIALDALFSRPKSSLSESFRNLRINLQFLNQVEKENKVIGFTSTISREGKTFCAVNTAASIAFSGKKVILIGADLRKPRMADAFDLKSSVGLTNYITGNKTLQEVIQPSGYQNLDVLMSGPIPPNPSEMLESSRFVNMMTDLRKEYDFIIIDSSPVGLVSDYYLVEKLVDVTLFVLRHRYSQKAFINDLDKLVKKEKFKRIFIVLNDLKSKNSYGYGYGYGYGDSGYGETQKPSILQKMKSKIQSLV